MTPAERIAEERGRPVGLHVAAEDATAIDAWRDAHDHEPDSHDARTRLAVVQSGEEAATAQWSERVTPCEAEWFTTAPRKRRWLLRDNRTAMSSGVIPIGKVGMLIGEGGVSKTMALVAFAIAVATGTTWLGCYDVDVDAQGRVLMLLGEEDSEEVQRRCYNAARASKTNPPPADSIIALPLAGVPCSMVETDEYGNATDAPFLTWFRACVAEHGPFKLILVDPLSRFAGADAEIDNAAATRFVQALESISTETGATVIVAHHTNKTARSNGAAVTGASARGSSAIYDGVRWAAALSAERVAAGDGALPDALTEIVTLSIVKSNYSRKGDPVFLRRDGDNGGALVPLDSAERGIVATARQAADPSTRRRAEREGDRETKAAREAAEREQRATLSATKDAARVAAEDTALRACVAAEPGVNEASLLSAMRARLGTCADRSARTAIERARLAGWLEVRTGAKNAKGHHVKAATP